MNRQDSTVEVEVISPSSLELIQRAEIDMQIATAKRYPRDLAKVKQRMMNFATLDEETAESCFYTLPRDGKTIQGPTVRLAEIAVACYGNLRAASRVIDNNGKIITSQAACHDLENNTLISVEVQRRITDRKGKTYSDDMQVTAGNAANSIAFRNAVFKVVPGALIKPVYEAAKAVAVGNASTLAVKRDKIVKRLNSMHVDTPRILAKLGRSSVENIVLEDLETLIGLGTAIKDGDTSVDEAFPPVGKNEERLEQQMREQAQAAGATDSPQDEGQGATASEEAPPKNDPQPPGTPATGSHWKTTPAMLADFERQRGIVGDGVFYGVLGRAGINPDFDLTVGNPATIAAFDELTNLAAQMSPATAAPQDSQPEPAATKPVEKLSFGGPKTRSIR